MIQSDQYVIETHNLSKSFGKVQALRGVTMAVPRNSIFGFLGPNGAGKTTLMKMLLGLSFPTSGEGSIFGQSIKTDSVAIRERVGYLPQQPRFIDYMTARENLRFAAKFFFRDKRSKIEERCDEMLELVGLTKNANQITKGFSGGEKQRLGIAIAQINYPDLLILDEPASALDPLGRQAILELMERLRKHTTIFFSTHILDDVQKVSDSVAILNHGQLVASGPIEQILNGKDGVVYSLNLKGHIDELQQSLAEFPWVTGIHEMRVNGSHSLQVSVSDESAAEKHLLRHVIANENITVLEFRQKKYELEEVFMEIVKGDNNEH